MLLDAECTVHIRGEGATTMAAVVVSSIIRGSLVKRKVAGLEDGVHLNCLRDATEEWREWLSCLLNEDVLRCKVSY